MKLTKSALSMLLNAYRSVVRQAWVKGLAGAVVLTAALSTGAANAQEWNGTFPGDNITWATKNDTSGNYSALQDSNAVIGHSGATTGTDNWIVETSKREDAAYSEITNHATIYIDSSDGSKIKGMMAQDGGSVINAGTIYINTGAEEDAYWKSFAMFACGGSESGGASLINAENGVINANRAIAMSVGSNGKGSLVINHGTINVYNKGAVGMEAANVNSPDTVLQNYGTITVNGSGAMGIAVRDGASGTTVHNYGKIEVSDEGSAAIVMGGHILDIKEGAAEYTTKTTGNKLVIHSGSEIEGAVYLGNGNAIEFDGYQGELDFQTFEQKDKAVTEAAKLGEEVQPSTDFALTNGAAVILTGSNTAKLDTLSFDKSKSALTISKDYTLKAADFISEGTAFSIENAGTLELAKASGDMDFSSGRLTNTGDLTLTGAAGSKVIVDSLSELIKADASLTLAENKSGKYTFVVAGEDEIDLAAFAAAGEKADFINAGTDTLEAALSTVTVGDGEKADYSFKTITANKLELTAQGEKDAAKTFNLAGVSSYTALTSIDSNAGSVKVEGSLTLGKAGSSAAASANGLNFEIAAVSAPEEEVSKAAAAENPGLHIVGGNWSGIGNVNVTGNSFSVDGASASMGKLTASQSGLVTLSNQASLTASDVSLTKADAVQVKDTSSFSTGYSKVVSGIKDETVSLTSGFVQGAVDLGASAEFQLNGAGSVLGSTIAKDDFFAIREAVLGENALGTFKLEGVSLQIAAADQNPDGSISADNVHDYAGSDALADKDVSGVNTDTKVTGSNSWGSAILDKDVSAVSVGDGSNQSSLTLNGTAGSSNFVTTADGKVGGVELKDKASLVLKNGGDIGEVTGGDASSVVTVQQQADQVTNILGKIDTKGQLAVSNGAVNVQSVSAGKLDLTGAMTVGNGSGDVSVGASGAQISGTLTAGEFSSKGDLNVSGAMSAASVKVEGKSAVSGVLEVAGAVEAGSSLAVTGALAADSLTVSKEGKVTVGDAENSGTISLKSLDLQGGMLLIDPDWDSAASVVNVYNPDADSDVVNVKGSVGIGRNSVGVFGADAAEAQAALSRLGYLKGGRLSENGVGAVMYLGQTFKVDAGKSVLVDKSQLNSDLDDAISGTSNSVTLSNGSALVISEDFADALFSAEDPSAIFSFGASAGSTASVKAEKGAEILIDSAAMLGGDTLTIAESDGAALDVDISAAEVIAANGLLTADQKAGNTLTFKLSDKAEGMLFNQSRQVKAMTLKVMGNEGEEKYDTSKAGVGYIAAMNAKDGGKAVEASSRLAVYAGAVQAALMAQQSSVDAV
ncbi:MAG: hypothetical protein IAB19_03225, partial [Proteobacteria bacterium]|nr:hypothetical protein [Candidatus Avisuccinivibrio stercorigallinarum]